MTTLDVTRARSHFPALQQEQVYMDNAGRWDMRRTSTLTFDSFVVAADE
jgi:selenocysteine lyase/cysteine desulfurase